METRYQLGFVRHAGWLIAVLGASTPQGTWESAMNEAASGLTSAANAARNFAYRGIGIHPEAGGLRLFATNGDDFCSVSEVQVFTPEPGSVMLVGLGLAVASGMKWRRLLARRP